MRRARTYRLTEEALAILDELAQRHGLSRTAILDEVMANSPRGSPRHDVLAVVDHAGHWLGAEPVAPGTLPPVAKRAEQEGGQGVYVPATCRSTVEVGAVIDAYLSDV